MMPQSARSIRHMTDRFSPPAGRFSVRAAIGVCVAALLALAVVIAPASAQQRQRQQQQPSAPAQQGAPANRAPPAPVNPLIPETSARQAVILDTSTGTVLFEKNADERMAPSSMSKIMTAYVVFDALKRGDLKLDDTLPVSERAWRMQGSKTFVPLGERVKIEDLIRGMIIQSGIDACVVLAEGMSGSLLQRARVHLRQG